MKKILFNDEYLLTQAVIERRKTMTQRVAKWDMIPGEDEARISRVELVNILVDGRVVYFGYDSNYNLLGETISIYGVGEVVAVAQNYEDAGLPPSFDSIGPFQPTAENHPGWKNKLFVRPDLMPYKIKMENIILRRIQDIDQRDSLSEGIQEIPYKLVGRNMTYEYGFAQRTPQGGTIIYAYSSPRDAFAKLFNKIAKKKLWEQNPWCFTYTFKKL